MCGISGYINYKNLSRKEFQKIILRMLDVTNHRGPDDCKYIIGNNYALGTNRLSIQTIEHGQQPIENKNYIVGFNGEIFNFFELKEQYNIKSKSEIEIILTLYEKFNVKFVEKLKGQFAIYVYDKREKNLFLFRDRFGIRPIYYSFNKSMSFSFSSEIKSILSVSEIDHSISGYSLAFTSMFWTNIGNHTSFENVYMLPANHYLKLNEKFQIDIVAYENNFFRKNKIENKSFDLYSSLRNSVKNQIFGEVGFCSYLSGGIDSSIIAYLLKDISKKKIDTFSISFEDKEYDESSAQNNVSKFLGTNHNTLKIKNNDISGNFLETVHATETFLFRTAPVPMYLLSKFVRTKGHKVFFTGEGADEILFGYDIFFETKIRKFWTKEKNSKSRFLLFKKLYKHLPQFQNSRYFKLIKDFYKTSLDIENDLFYSHFVRWSQYNFMSSYFNLNDSSKFNADNLLEKFLDTLPKDFINVSLLRRAQYIECVTLLSNYLLSSQGDRVSMANSMEGRYPYLDENLLNDTINIDQNVLAPGLKSKKLLRDSFKKLLPQDVLNRPKIAYQAPEARSFFDGKKPSKIIQGYLDSVNSLEFQNSKNVLDLVNKIQDPLSSKRLGFRENMAFIIGLSGYCLKDFQKKYRKNKNEQIQK